jgi:hypothetical protein
MGVREGGMERERERERESVWFFSSFLLVHSWVPTYQALCSYLPKESGMYIENC